MRSYGKIREIMKGGATFSHFSQVLTSLNFSSSCTFFLILCAVKTLATVAPSTFTCNLLRIRIRNIYI